MTESVTDTDSTPLLSLRGLRKHYGGHDGAPATEVLRGVSLDIHAGEFVAIVGSSGSGKSTLMHLLGALDRPSSGTYQVAGRDVAALDADQLAWLRREAFGFVFQGYHLIATESARENVEIPALYAGTPASEREARATALLARLGLGQRLDHRPGQLSGGQQQRVSIARALMNGGRIILADEPTGALDSHSSAEVMQLLVELADAGHTVILITHDREIAARARRVIEIRDGEIIADTGPAPVADTAARAADAWPPLFGASNHPDTRFTGLVGDLHEALRAAWRVLWINPFRTGLTLLGIIIGVASVIVMLAVGSGSQFQVMKKMAVFGANKMYVAATPATSRDRTGPLSLADVETMREIPNVDIAMPYLEGFAIARRGNIDHRTEVGGVTTQFEAALDWPLAAGVFFDDEDERTLAKVAIIGKRVRTALFEDGTDPVGQTILLDSVPFQVIGVLQEKGALAGNADEDDRVVVPYSTASARIFGTPYPTWVAVAIRKLQLAKQTEDAIIDAMAVQRGQRDVRVYNRAESIRASAETERTMTMMLGLIAAISLLVGGIGVMNVMLMTVRERTREIGIRMATGARQRDILRQFMTEAVVVSVIGGVVGVVGGTLVGIALRLAGIPAILSLTAILGAFSCAVATGLLFGYMPARNAARLDPVQALNSD
ncbi:MacB family efflux pump subunit [Cupriavidus sp. DL-D2]|uniref:MacB family efflux pump subunit n=1 Tax=Cupriavidus sp. DL-D2 TaxID=3144974 RepID=UPI003214F38A